MFVWSAGGGSGWDRNTNMRRQLISTCASSLFQISGWCHSPFRVNIAETKVPIDFYFPSTDSRWKSMFPGFLHFCGSERTRHRWQRSPTSKERNTKSHRILQINQMCRSSSRLLVRLCRGEDIVRIPKAAVHFKFTKTGIKLVTGGTSKVLQYFLLFTTCFFHLSAGGRLMIPNCKCGTAQRRKASTSIHF